MELKPQSILLISFSLFLFFSFFITTPGSTQTTFCEAQGWAWSDTIDWISFSCEDGPPTSDPGANCPVCNGGDSGDCCSCIREWYPGWDDYGIEVIESSGYGIFEGFTWNDYVGWINFGPINDWSGWPTGAYQQEPRIDFSDFIPPDPDNKPVHGWAKIVNFGSGGWISMSCETDPDPTLGDCTGYDDYQVYYDGCYFRGWAWSDDVGWICFNCEDDDSTGCDAVFPGGGLVGDFYRVKCGQAVGNFSINSASFQGDSPCDTIEVVWVKSLGATTYSIYRAKWDGSEPVWPDDFGLPIKDDYIQEQCGTNLCYYDDSDGLEPETKYSYKITAGSGCEDVESNNFVSARTTICPPELTFCIDELLPIIGDCPSTYDNFVDGYCDEIRGGTGTLRLEWGSALDGIDSCGDIYSICDVDKGECTYCPNDCSPADCCGNLACDGPAGENFSTCPGDCGGPVSTCDDGNNICDVDKGECSFCSTDCSPADCCTGLGGIDPDPACNVEVGEGVDNCISDCQDTHNAADLGYSLYYIEGEEGGSGYKKEKDFKFTDDDIADYYIYDVGLDKGTYYYTKFDFDPGEYYYFFVRSLDGLDGGIAQDVDTNRAVICCATQ